MRKNRQILALGAAAAVALAVVCAPSPPHANIRILTHNTTDRAPQRVQAAVDLGVVAVSVLVTWSRQLTR